ncbi:MAG: ATP-binding protein [Burkholderiales bacterium]|nr:ATP-binding protein [Burkholderiales bacterium]
MLIVAIDDDSLAQVWRWPWRRVVTAQLLEPLQAGAPRAIGVDLLLTEPAVGDERLGAAVAGPAPGCSRGARSSRSPIGCSAWRTPPSAPCRCDASLVRRALVNLLDNAMRVAPPGSAITLGLARHGDGWTLSVTDGGPGIDPADRERIFEPWWRGATADPSSGAGLGLAFVATVAERHGGRARALAGPDGGARIELWLPDEPELPEPG